MVHWGDTAQGSHLVYLLMLVQVPWIVVRVEKGILSPHERLLHLINLIFRSFNPQLWSSCAKPDRLSGD